MCESENMNDQCSAISFLTELWLLFDTHFEQEAVGQSIVSALKRTNRDRAMPLRMASLVSMFRLLEKFSYERNRYAPSVYKSLIFSLVENHHDVGTREFMLVNFS